MNERKAIFISFIAGVIAALLILNNLQETTTSNIVEAKESSSPVSLHNDTQTEPEYEVITPQYPLIDKKAKITAYTCDPSMTPEQKAMNCPSILKNNNPMTASGKTPEEGLTIACSRELLGKSVFIDGIGIRECQDTGGSIKGNNIDLFVNSYQEAINFGVQYKKYYVID